jgi:BR serine/threonine kinase
LPILHIINQFNLSISFGDDCAGKVKLAFHRESGERVAVKIVTKEFLFSSPNMRRKVEREIAIMKLLDNPHVLSLLDVYETTKYLYGCRSLASWPQQQLLCHFLLLLLLFLFVGVVLLIIRLLHSFLVLEHVEGGELFDYLVKRGSLPLPEAMTFFLQILQGVEYCHAHFIWYTSRFAWMMFTPALHPYERPFVRDAQSSRPETRESAVGCQQER